MLKRCIMIFPDFKNVGIIDEIRDKYDPLAKHVKPHITLVFPFESNIETKHLKNHIEGVVKKISPFEIILQGIRPVKSFGNYLFLDVQKGKENIIRLHERLYTGVLETYYPKWLKGGEFLPHMTVGCLEDEAFEIACNDTSNVDDCFKSIIDKVSVEIIDENEDSIIELNISLEGSTEEGV